MTETLKIPNLCFLSKDPEVILEYLNSEEMIELVKKLTYKAIKEAENNNSDIAYICQINSTGNIITLQKPEWNTFLNEYL